MSLDTQRRPTPEGADTWIAWQDPSDETKYRLKKLAQVRPPKRELSIGGLDLHVTPAEAPIDVSEGPEGITATVGQMPSQENIIVPYLKVTTPDEQAPHSPIRIEGRGKVIMIVGPGVQADADRPGRTKDNTIVWPLPGASVKKPNPQAA